MTSSRQAERPAVGLRERKKAKTRAALKQHALRLFSEQGYAETTIDQIAEAAEVSQSTFFRYFPTKEALILQDDYDPMLFESFRTQPAELTPIQAIRAAIHDIFTSLSEEEWAQEQIRQNLMASVPELRAATLDQYVQTIGMLAGLIAERIGRSPDEFEVKVFSGAIIGVAMAATAGVTEHASRGYMDLLDAGLAHLEAGLPL